MRRILLAAVVAVSLTACTRPDHATTVLTEAGYTNIEITGYSWFTCSKDDTFHTGFKATSPTGQRVSGAVCGGWLKGSTIRFD